MNKNDFKRTYQINMLCELLKNFDNSELQKINLDMPGVKYARESIKKDHIISSSMVGSIAGKFQEAMNKMTLDNSNNLINEILKLNFDESQEMMLKISEIIYNKIIDEPFNNYIYILIFIGTKHRAFQGKTLINYFINIAKNNFDQTFLLTPNELADMYFEREMGEEINKIDILVKKKCGLMRALVRMYLEKTYVSFDIIYDCMAVLINNLEAIKIINNISISDLLDEDDTQRYRCALSFLYGSMLFELLDEGTKPHKSIKMSGNQPLNEVKSVVDIISNKLIHLIDLLLLSSVKNNLKNIIEEKYGIIVPSFIKLN
jgi:hypothetical protein